SPNHRRPLGACAAPLARLHVGAVWLCSTGTLAHAVGPRRQDQRDRTLVPDPGLTGPGTIPCADSPGVADHPTMVERDARDVLVGAYGVAGGRGAGALAGAGAAGREQRKN